jgi:hypothetical protein
MNAPALVPLAAGASVSAIVPSTIEETWRLATMIVQAGLAPQALVGREPVGQDVAQVDFDAWAKKATSAVAIVIMSGAELSLPPMVSLRSFTVIGGKPALYGDGIINVVRRSRKAAYVRTGYDAERKVGWCEAKRSDTGEEKRVEFSMEDAARAGLLPYTTTVRRKFWEGGKEVWKEVPHDAPWARYPQRMAPWRAAGYCLRELFADVLGGVRDEFEAAEIATIEHRDDEPSNRASQPPSPSAPMAPSPPKVPALPPLATAETQPEAGNSAGDFDYSKFFDDLENDLAAAGSPDAVQEVWNAYDVEATFQDDDQSRQLAEDLRGKRIEALRGPGLDLFRRAADREESYANRW